MIDPTLMLHAERPRKPRGFALLTPEERRALGARGGKSGSRVRGFALNRELARAAGRIGGAAPRNTRHSYTSAELDQFAEELHDESRAEQRETDESRFGVASLFRNSHR